MDKVTEAALSGWLFICFLFLKSRLDPNNIVNLLHAFNQTNH